MPFSPLLPNALTAEQEEQAARDRRHAERDRQIASLMKHFAKHPEALAKLVKDMRVYEIFAANRRNAEANHDYVDGFEERWADEHASLKRGP